MAFDPWTNPVGTHTGPWLFEQALACMRGGGKVRQESDPPGSFIHIVGNRIVDERGEEAVLWTIDILACNWQAYTPATKDGA